MGPAVSDGSDSEVETARLPCEGAWFRAAGSDPVTWVQTALLLLVLGLLVLLGGAQAVASWRVGAWTEFARDTGFVALGLILGYLTIVRMPVAYRVVDDPRHGAVLEVRLRAASPARLRLGDYLDAIPRRVVFPWIPLVSGTRMFGLRGARVEQMVLGFWSFGRDGRRALVLTGPGRPLTLVSPLDQDGFLAAVQRGIDGRSRTMEATFGAVRLVLEEGDITRVAVDAIVNAANSALMGGGGVDGAIRDAGGPAISEECRVLRSTTLPDGLPTGEAVATTAGTLLARRVIHTVGPVWYGGDSGEGEALARAYRSCLRVAREEGLGTVAFPSISTGAYGYPVDAAARIALETVRAEVLAEPGSLTEVRFVLFGSQTLRAYEQALGTLARSGS
jgi:O-acetyl-ADP-ribose deacetylase